MTRTGIAILFGYAALVFGVVWLAFGNPFTVEGERASQLVGYLLAQVFSAVVLFAIYWVVTVTHRGSAAGIGSGANIESSTGPRT